MDLQPATLVQIVLGIAFIAGLVFAVLRVAYSFYESVANKLEEREKELKKIKTEKRHEVVGLIRQDIAALKVKVELMEKDLAEIKAKVKEASTSAAATQQGMKAVTVSMESQAQNLANTQQTFKEVLKVLRGDKSEKVKISEDLIMFREKKKP